MYAQVTVIASYDAVKLRQALIAQVGPTRITPLAALARTVLARNAREIAPAVVVAQSIRTAVTILYFFDGPSSISIHIKAPTLVGLKAHIARVALELLSELPQGRKIIEAELFTQTARGGGAALMRGTRVSLLRQLVDIAAEKWISKMLVPAVVFALTSSLLAGTPSVASALIGLIAALLAFLVELSIFAYHGNVWK